MLRPLAGDGALARAGSLVLLCADDDRLPGLLATLDEGGDGRRLCRRLATLLSASGLDDAPALCAFGPSGDGLAVLVHGAAVVEVDAAGQTVRLDGATAVTWVDRVISGPVEAVRAALAGTDPGAAPDSWARLDAGVIRAGGLVFGIGVPDGPVDARPSYDDATAAASLVELEGEDAQPEPAVAPQPEPEPEPAPVAAVAPQPEPVPVSVPPATPLPAPAPAPVPAPTVRVTPAQPLGGVLVLDDGTVFRLDASYVVGREPERDQDVVGGHARALRIADREGVVSRVHARVVVEGQAVFVVDLGSSNGTHLCEPGSEVWMRIPPRTPVPIVPGTMVLFGRRGIRYEVR